MYRWAVLRPFIVRPLWQRPARVLPALLGIALGTAVIVAIRLANTSVLEAFVAATDSLGGQTDVRIYGASGPIDERQFEQLLWLEQYGTVSPILETYGMLVDRHVEAIADSSRPLARGEVLMVLGVDLLQDQQLRQYDVWQWAGGTEKPELFQMLEMLVEPDSVVLTERFAARHGVEIGDRIRLAFGSRVVTLQVRGLLRDTGPARTWQGNFALMDLATAQAITGRMGQLDAIDVRFHPDRDWQQAMNEVRSRLPSGLWVEPPAGRAGRVQTMVAAFQFNLEALSMVALVVGLVLVGTTVSYSVTSRRDEIAVLLAVGSSRWAVAGLFVTEALLVACAGAVLGLPLGHWLAQGAVQATSRTVETFYVAAVAEATAGRAALSASESLRCVLLVLVAAAAAALRPAWQAACLDPLQVLHPAHYPGAMGRPNRPIEPLLWAVAGGLAVAVPPIDGRPWGGFLAALSFAAALASLAPATIRLTASVARKLQRTAGITLHLAAAYLAAGGVVTSAAVSALAMALGMMFAIAVMVSSFRTTVVYWLDSVLTSDLVIKPVMSSATLSSATLDPQIVDRVRRLPEVRAVTWYTSRQIPFGPSMIRLDTSDLDVLLEHGRVRFKEPAGAALRVRDRLRYDKRFLLVSESFSLRYKKYPGDSVVLHTPHGEVALPVAAVYYDYSSNLGTLLIDFDVYRQLFDDDRPQRSPMALSLYLQENTNVEKLSNRIRSLVGKDQLIYCVTNKELRAEALRIFDSTFAITYALLVIAVLVAIVGVVAALYRLIQLHRRELALMSCVGLTPWQLKKIVLVASLLTAMLSYGLGWAIGMALSIILVYVINVQSFGWTIQLHAPWEFLAESFTMVVLAAVLCGWWPARKAAGVDPIAVLRDE
ncbi:MAG: permease [Pirellulaceae bacterium]|nr:MAG: permease [Pirellulaceae bacterium]